MAAETLRVAWVLEIPTPYREPLLGQLASQGIQSKAFYCARREYGRDWSVGPLLNGFEYEFLPGKMLQWKGTQRPLAIKFNPAVIKALASEPFDAVVIGGYAHPTMQLAMLVCRRQGIPYLLLSESHHLTRRPLLLRLAKRPLVQIAARGAAACLAMGSNAKDYLVAHGADPARVYFFPNTPDVGCLRTTSAKLRSQHSQLRQQLNLSDKLVILFVGQLTGVKGVDILLNAMRLIQQNGFEAVLMLVGDGPLRAVLEAEAARLGLGDVRFAGYVQPDELARYYTAAAVFGLPSRDEPWGVVVLEAMACGLPIVVSDKVGCARDLVQNGRNGFVVPVDNPKALAEALLGLLEDALLRKRMGRQSQEIVQNWDYEFCISQLEKALAVAVERK